MSATELRRLPRANTILADTGVAAIECVHHVPGRLRASVVGARNDLRKLEAICDELAAVRGVRSATPNPLTGSIVIDYDPSALDPKTVSAAFGPPRSRMDGRDLPAWAEQIGAKAIEWMLEKLAVALIAAVV